jgi:uncharacterized glyoxalase superfamily protein PhnB
MQTQAVIPMLSYENGIAALEWLSKAFGFRERTRMTDKDGRLSHGEMEAVMVLLCSHRQHQIMKRPKNTVSIVSRLANGHRYRGLLMVYWYTWMI